MASGGHSGDVLGKLLGRKIRLHPLNGDNYSAIHIKSSFMFSFMATVNVLDCLGIRNDPSTCTGDFDFHVVPGIDKDKRGISLVPVSAPERMVVHDVVTIPKEVFHLARDYSRFPIFTC